MESSLNRSLLGLSPEMQERFAAFCHRWKVQSLELFGSVARGDTGEASDLDFLVSFLPDARWSLWDHARMQGELADLLGRDVDLVTRRAVERSENQIRRQAILEEARSVCISSS